MPSQDDNISKIFSKRRELQVLKRGGTKRGSGPAKLHKDERVEGGKREQDETPEYEARSHSKRFLQKAARLAGKEKSSRRGRQRGR